MEFVNIDTLKEVMVSEHAAQILRRELWWSIVPYSEEDFSHRINKFWTLVDTILEMGQPLGFINSAPYSDPKVLLDQLITPNAPNISTESEAWLLRVKYSKAPKEKFKEGMEKACAAAYKEEIRKAEQKKKEILLMRDTYEEIDVLVPFERIENAKNKILEKMSQNPRVPDAIFHAEVLLWEEEVKKIKFK